MKVVITGGSSGIGLALMEEFLSNGDEVVYTTRNDDKATKITRYMNTKYDGRCLGVICDVRYFSNLVELGKLAVGKLGTIDIWINNAGIVGSKTTFTNESELIIQQIIETNLLGTLYGTKVALEIMTNQGYGLIFNMEGRGSNGKNSPNMTVYSTTKYALMQLQRNLVLEIDNPKIGINHLSPGMVLTPLLVDGTSAKTRQVFNILAELPHTVATWMVPKIKSLKGTGKRIRYLTSRKAAIRFMLKRRYKNKFFDDLGNFINDDIENSVYRLF